MAFNWSDWVGLPYEELGRGPAAYDCWGLVRAVLQAGLGVSLPVFLDYTIHDIPAAIAQYKELDNWNPVPPPYQPFDLVFFTMSEDPHHVGIMIDSGNFLHLARESESLIERIASRRWVRRVEGAYRHDSL